MLEPVAEVARSFGAEVAALTVDVEWPPPVETLTIAFAGSRVTAIARQESVQLVCVVKVDPEESALLARSPGPLQREVMSFLRLEGMRGRSRFQVAFDETPAGLGVSELVLEQRVFLIDGSQAWRQRIGDGLIEIAALAVRIRMAFDRAIGSLLS